MSLDKAAIFVDNSNIFKGMSSFSRVLVKSGGLKPDEFLRMRWDRLVTKLEQQDGGLDIFARHFFASLPPAADVGACAGARQKRSGIEW